MFMTIGAGEVTTVGTVHIGAMATAGVDTHTIIGAGIALGGTIAGAGPVATMDGDIPIMVVGATLAIGAGEVTTTVGDDPIITITTMVEITRTTIAVDVEDITHIQLQAPHFEEGPT